MKIVTFARAYPKKEWDGATAIDFHYSRLADENFIALKSDQNTLFVLKKNAFDADFMSEIKSVFKDVNADSVSPIGELVEKQPLKTKLSTVGFFEGIDKAPSGLTEWSSKNGALWERAQVLARKVWAQYKELCPSRAGLQLASINPKFQIIPTGFSSITVGRDNPREYHKDEGNFVGGMTVLCVEKSAEVSGCRLVFPEFRVAAELEHGDLVCFDSFEFHGNTPIEGEGRTVYGFYLREKLNK